MKINFIVKKDLSNNNIHIDPFFVLTIDSSNNLKGFFKDFDLVHFVKSKKDGEEIARDRNNVACINYYENKKQELENNIQDYEDKIENMQDYLNENY